MSEVSQKPKGKFKTVSCGACGASREVVRGSWLRKKREEHGVSLRQVARDMDLSAMYISDVEREVRNATKKIAQHYDQRFGRS